MKKIILDFESSGLERGSFPVEVAWAGEDLKVKSYLICPTDIWLDDNRLWDPAAERMHGLSRPYLKQNGEPVATVADALTRELPLVQLFSNNPLYDQDWLHRLLSAADCDSFAKVFDFHQLLAEMTDIEDINLAYHRAHKISPVTHRASQDVLHLWEVYRQCKLLGDEARSTHSSGSLRPGMQSSH